MVEITFSEIVNQLRINSNMTNSIESLAKSILRYWKRYVVDLYF
ncbi:TFIIS helical bundle-like domain protein [Leptospira interrogans serovar Lora str. TE 1992]|uniref:TFIIS helical bundle-like domain protein n=1 Tax=Leptospira interrogans serovar Lora str. TE 1992 TaxID=1193028 RepID=M3EZV3_LEPIR|nr:TFIIS helical bundle-like domain protein [Leptospira interrogans serovar Lora str. TE 1992]